jgi:zinc protease
VSVSARQASYQIQSVFTVEATARKGVTTERLAREMDAVLEEIRAGKVTDGDVARARAVLETRLMTRMDATLGRAVMLQALNAMPGGPRGLPQALARYDSVTPEEVVVFAREKLAQRRRVVMHAVQAAGGPVGEAAR